MIGAVRPLALRTSTVVEPPTVPVPTTLVDLVWHDTPDYYTTAVESRYWATWHADCLVLPTGGYLGGGGWSGSSEDAYSIAHPRQIPAASDAFGFGLRLQLTGYPSAPLTLLAPVDDDDTKQVELQISPDGTLRVVSDGVELAVSALSLPTYTDIKLGFRGRVSSTVGEVEVLVAYGTLSVSTPVIRRTGVNTAAAGTAVWTGLYLGRPPAWRTSHAYAGVGLGGLRPGYLVRFLAPATEDDSSEWLPNVGTAVDALASPPDDDATYIYASAIDQRYLMAPEAMPTVRAVYGVRTVALVENLPGQTVSHAPVVGDGVSVSVSPWQSVADDAWTMVDRFDARHPVSEVTWTSASVTAAVFGGQVAA